MILLYWPPQTNSCSLLIKLPFSLIYICGGILCPGHQLSLSSPTSVVHFLESQMSTIWFPDSHWSCILSPGLDLSSLLCVGFVFSLYWVAYNKILCNSIDDLQCFKRLTVCLLNMTMSIASAKLIQVSDRLLHWPMNFSPSRWQLSQGGWREGLSWEARDTAALATATLYIS